MLTGRVGQFKQRQGEIGADGQVEFGVAVRRNDDGTIADAARDPFPAHIQFRAQAVNRKRAIVGVFYVEPNREILLQ